MNHTLHPQTPTFRLDLLLAAPASRAFLFLALSFVVSPLSLYVSRLYSLVVVLALIATSLFFLVIPKFSLEGVPTPIDLPCAIFLGYLAINGIIAIGAGNHMNNVMADLVSPLQVYLCFEIAKRTKFSAEVVYGWIKWLLLFATLRAAWQIVTTLAGIHMLAPIYDASVSSPLATIGRFTYERPIDPVSGIIFAVALTIYLTGFERKRSVMCAIASAAVLILGMTRSEWIAGILAVGTAMWYAGLLRKALSIAAIVALVLVLAFAVVPGLYSAVSDRLITHTLEQVSESSQEDAALGALRILEFGTAMEKFKTAPVFGHGLGSWFGTDVTRDQSELIFVQFHNSYLNLLANAGLVGVGLLLFILLRLRRFLLAGMRYEDATVRALFCVAIASLVWYGIFMAFEPIYASYHLPVLIGILWGMATQKYYYHLRRLMQKPST